MCFVVSLTYSTILSRPLRIDRYLLWQPYRCTSILALRLFFLPRINQAFNEFKELCNNHQIRTESNSIPNQMWLKSSKSLIDNDTDNANIYGMFMEWTLKEHYHWITVIKMLLILNWYLIMISKSFDD